MPWAKIEGATHAICSSDSGCSERKTTGLRKLLTSVDVIMQRHGLKTEARHRAMGDVELVVAYLEMARRELGSRQVQETAAVLLKDQSVPAGLDASILHQIPDRPGVYFFYGKNGLPLYIGKSVTLRCGSYPISAATTRRSATCALRRRSSGSNGWKQLRN